MGRNGGGEESTGPGPGPGTDTDCHCHCVCGGHLEMLTATMSMTSMFYNRLPRRV